MTAVALLLLAFQVTSQLQQHIEAGLKAKTAGDLDTAIREFARVAELAPNLAAAHVNLGAVHLGRQDYNAAIPALRRALELNQDLPGAHAMLGTALLAQGFGCEAIPHLSKSNTEELLGVALLDCDRPREALDRLEAALENRPDDPDLLFYAGQAHNALAGKAFDKLRTTHPNSARTHQIIGEALAASGNTTAAEERLRAALAARSDLRGVHHALGELYLQAGSYQKAETHFRAEARMSPGSASAAYKLGLSLVHLGQNEEARTELERADRLRPGMPETMFQLGKLYNALGNTKRAEEYLVKVLTAEQHTELAESAHFQLAQVYRKLGRAADAERQTDLFRRLRSRRANPSGQ